MAVLKVKLKLAIKIILNFPQLFYSMQVQELLPQEI